MAVAQTNRPATSHRRQICLHAQQRQRAPFSCGCQTLPRPRKHRKQPPASCPTQSHQKPLPGPQITALSAQQPFSYSTYRDDGAWSELSIADSIDQATLQGQPESQASHASPQTCATSIAGAPHAAQEHTAAETARRRQLRQCYPTSHSDTKASQATHLQHEAANSNFLERRPKVQIASRLRGCTTEPLPERARMGLLEGEQQLALWYQYNFAEKAVAEANTLQAQLGHPASDSQIAAALSCPMPFSLSQCLAIGKSARLQLVAANMGLVYKVAHQYDGQKDVSFDDLVHEGLSGLDIGLRMYSPNRGAKLSTALFWYVRRAIGTFHRLHSQIIHIPLTTQEQITLLRKVVQQYQQTHPGEFPPDTHLMKEMRLRKLAIKRVKQAASLSERSYDLLSTARGSSANDIGDINDNLIDLITGGNTDFTEAQHAELLHMDVQSLVAMLPDPQGPVLQLRYGLQDGQAKSLDEVAKRLNMTAFKVAQHQRAALAALNSSAGGQHLEYVFSDAWSASW